MGYLLDCSPRYNPRCQAKAWSWEQVFVFAPNGNNPLYKPPFNNDRITAALRINSMPFNYYESIIHLLVLRYDVKFVKGATLHIFLNLGWLKNPTISLSVQEHLG